MVAMEGTDGSVGRWRIRRTPLRLDATCSSTPTHQPRSRPRALCSRASASGHPHCRRGRRTPRRPDAGGVVWFDARPGADARELTALLEPHCPGIELAMVEDLLQPDEEPSGTSYG